MNRADIISLCTCYIIPRPSESCLYYRSTTEKVRTAIEKSSVLIKPCLVCLTQIFSTFYKCNISVMLIDTCKLRNHCIWFRLLPACMYETSSLIFNFILRVLALSTHRQKLSTELNRQQITQKTRNTFHKLLYRTHT